MCSRNLATKSNGERDDDDKNRSIRLSSHTQSIVGPECELQMTEI